MPIDLYPNIAKIKRGGVYQNLPGFVQQSGDADIEAMIANSESSTTAQYAHPEGSYFILNDVLYKAIISIAVNDTIAVGTNCEVAILSNDVSDMESDVSNLKTTIIDQTNNASDWEQGYYEIASGETGISDKWIRTVQFLADNIIKVFNSENLLLYLQAWDKTTGNYIGTWNGHEWSTTYTAGTGLFVVDIFSFRKEYPNYNFRITVTKTNSAQINPNDNGTQIYFIKSVIIYIEKEIDNIKRNININNIIGTDITRVYPCYIPPYAYSIISTSDGSNFTSNTLILFGKNGEYLNTWALGSSYGNNRVIPARNYEVHYVCTNTDSVPLMFNIGSHALPYIKYKPNLDAQLSELMELKQAIENGYIEISEFISGQRDGWGSILTVSGTKCTTKKVYALSKGDSIKISSVDNGLKVAIAGVKNNSYLYDSGWKTGEFTYTVEENTSGFYFVNIARVNDSSLTPTEILTTKIQIRNSAFVPKTAESPIITALSHVVWDSQNPTGQSYIDAVESAFNN